MPQSIGHVGKYKPLEAPLLVKQTENKFMNALPKLTDASFPLAGLIDRCIPNSECLSYTHYAYFAIFGKAAHSRELSNIS